MDTQTKLNPVGEAAFPNAASKPPLRMTYEEYQAWSGEDKHTEWVNGKVIQFGPSKTIHQSVNGFLHNLLSAYVELFKLGYIGIAPIEVRVIKISYREPDIVFVSKKRMSIVNDDRIEGAPDLIIEIVSKDSVQRDREDKYDEYEAAGVREYWIIDNRPRRQSAEFYRLNAESHYNRVELSNGVFRSEVLPNFWLRTDWLWEKFPNALNALDEIVGLENLAKLAKKK